MKNRSEVKALLAHFINQREKLPKFSKLGTDNHSEIDELKRLFTHYLTTGDIPMMDNYLEDTSFAYAIWLIGKYPVMDEIISDMIADEEFNNESSR